KGRCRPVGFKKQRVKGKGPKSKRLNQFLDQEHSRLFQCYQELRAEGKVADLMLLTPQNLVIGIDKKFWIITRREKNGNQVKLPLLSKAINLIEDYKNDQNCLLNNSLLPTISNQKVNSYLKEIAEKCHIE
ncbi:hypothetical protein B4N84_17230, partial [Flavobacterium sp. IR1]